MIPCSVQGFHSAYGLRSPQSVQNPQIHQSPGSQYHPQNSHNLSSDSIQARVALADSFFTAHRYSESQQILEDLLPGAREKLGERDPLVADIRHHLGRAYIGLGMFTEGGCDGKSPGGPA